METEYFIEFIIIITQYRIIITNLYLFKIALKIDFIAKYPVLFEKQ